MIIWFLPQYFTAGSLGRVGESLDLQLLPVAMASIFPPRVMSTHQPSALTKKGKWWGYCFCPGSSERVTCESPLSTQVTMADDYSDCTPHPRLTGQGMFKIPLQFSPSVISYSLQPCGLQHARLPCPPTPGAYSNSCPLSRWGHPTISSFSSNLRSFPNQGLFKWLVLCIRWPKYWIFSFSISPSNEYSGLISFRMDWLDFLAIGTLKSLLQQEPTFLAISAGDSNKFVHRLHIEKPWCRSLHLRQHFEFLCWIWYTYHCHSYSKLKHLLTFLWAWQCVKFFCIPVHIVLIS